MKAVSCVYTYSERRIYKISRRGQSVSGTPVSPRPPVIGADTSRLITHYTNILNREMGEERTMEQEVNGLSNEVNHSQIQLKAVQSQLRKMKGRVQRLEETVDNLGQQKADLEDDTERSTVHERINELKNCIGDEEQVIAQYTAEIAPYTHQIDDIERQEEDKKRMKDQLQETITGGQQDAVTLKDEFQRFLDSIKKERENIDLFPKKLERYEGQKMELENKVAEGEKEMARMEAEARNSGDQVLWVTVCGQICVCGWVVCVVMIRLVSNPTGFVENATNLKMF